MSNDHKKIASASAAEPLGAELERLLQPTHYFQHPRDVVRDAILTTAEKRAILSSWASDACAIESTPELRQIPASGRVVKFDEVIDALQELDGKANDIGGMEKPQRRRRGPDRGGNASWPLRERIPRALNVRCRSFLRTRLCQWLSLPKKVLMTATAVRCSS